jgi:outer membrane protein assembly factor BamB
MRVKSLFVAAAVAAAVVGCRKVTPVDEIVAPAGSAGPVLTPAVAAPGTWPWWRGPNQNGVAEEQSAPTSWSESDHVLWKAPVHGRGHSSPTVVGDRIYLATADDASQTQSVIALNRNDGTLIWERTLNQGGFPSAMHQNSTHANGTVACDGERLFIAFLHHEAVTAYALDLQGEPLWERQIGAFNSQFGYAPSPMLHGSHVIVAGDNRGGGWIAAVHRQTGEITWRKARPTVSTYSSPVVANVAGRDQLLISGCNEVSSYDPASGNELWSCAGTTEATCGTMVWEDGFVVASGGYPGSQTICVDAASGDEVWSNSQKCYEQSLLLHGGHVYAINNNGAFCWDVADGREAWRGRLNGKFSASPVLAGEHIYSSNEAGTTFVIKADPSAFELVAENQLGQEAFATPTICGGRIYLRVAEHTRNGRQEQLYCIGE